MNRQVYIQSILSLFTKNKPLLLLPLYVSVLLFLLGGCVSNTNGGPAHPSELQLLREQVEQTKLARDRYKHLLENAATVSEATRAEAELRRAQEQYQDALRRYNNKLEDIEENKGFKKSPVTIYGPIGIAIHLTEWIIEKLYILYP